MEVTSENGLAKRRAQGDALALLALDRVRQDAYERGFRRTRLPSARREANFLLRKNELPLGEPVKEMGPGFASSVTGPRPSARDPHFVCDIVSQITHVRGWEDHLAVSHMLEQWKEIIGPNLSKHMWVESFEPGGILIVRVSSAAWKEQMETLREILLARVQDEMGANVVKKIVVKGPQSRVW